MPKPGVFFIAAVVAFTPLLRETLTPDSLDQHSIAVLHGMPDA
jgi:hypothetical protein